MIVVQYMTVSVFNTLRSMDEHNMSTSFHSLILRMSNRLIHDFNSVYIQLDGSYTSIGLFGINSNTLILQYICRGSINLKTNSVTFVVRKHMHLEWNHFCVCCDVRWVFCCVRFMVYYIEFMSVSFQRRHLWTLE